MAQQGGVTEIVMVHLYYLVPVKKEAVAAAMMNKQRMQWLAYCSRKATLHRNTSCSCCCLNSVFFLRGMLLPELLSCSCWTGPQATSACVRCCALHHRPAGPALGPSNWASARTAQDTQRSKEKKRENRGSNPGLRHKTRPTLTTALHSCLWWRLVLIFLYKSVSV